MTVKGSNGSNNGEIPGRHLIIILTLLILGPVIAFMVSGNSDSNGKTAVSYPVPGASKYFYVQDYSGVFSHAAEKYIFDEAARLNRETTAQIAVLAVPHTGSESVGAYSRKAAGRLRIGDQEKNNGILILFTTDEPHVSLQVGKGLVKTIPNDRAKRIIDEYAVADKNSRHWNKAAMNTFTAVAGILYRKYGKEVPASLAFVAEVPEGLQGHTFGDMTLPEARSDAEDDEDLPLRLAWALAVFIMLAMGLVLIYVPFLSWQSGGNSSGDGGYNWGGDWSGGSDCGGSDGGGFGGDGASD